MGMDKPLVSVVLCTYNGEKFLEAQLESILDQSWQPLELVISDDASTDGTKAILQKYKGRPGVQIFYQEKSLGISGNFSYASSNTNGAFIAFSDQDDVWGKDKIEKLVGAIGKAPLVYSDSLLMNKAGEQLNKKLSNLKRMYSGDDSRCYFLYSCVWGHGMLVTRELLQKCLPFPGDVHHDIWIVFQAFLNGGIKYFDEALTWYRFYEDSAANQAGKNRSRYAEYQKNLKRLEIMQIHERPEYQPFYLRLLELYRRKESGYVWPLVFFMLKHREAIFRLSKKGFLSQVVEILKQGRRESL
jgi:glycosyltransferase involved in cell wall biosynthesis